MPEIIGTTAKKIFLAALTNYLQAPNNVPRLNAQIDG